METAMLISTLISLALFAGFVAIGIRKFGLLRSYSAYSPEWDKAVPMLGIHLWSLVTFFVAFFLMIPMIERGMGNPWQFLGFFAPLYLIIVAAFPLTEEKPDETEKEKKERERRYRIHCISAAVCAIVSILWLALICHKGWLVLVSLLVFWCAAYATLSVKKSCTFWCEMAAFASVYVALM